MSKQDLINEINRLLINNKLSFIEVKTSLIKVVDLNAILNEFKKRSFFHTPLVALLWVIDAFPFWFIIHNHRDEE